MNPLICRLDEQQCQQECKHKENRRECPFVKSTDNPLLEKAKAANGYSLYAKGSEKYNAFNEGYLAGASNGLKVTGETSDGYHTFNELYEFRKVYNAVLFNEWARSGKYNVHKSYKHFNGELAFGGGWFIVVALLPTGQITNHYENKDWDLFNIPAEEKALFEFDGHSGLDTLERLKLLSPSLPVSEPEDDEWVYCPNCGRVKAEK